MLSKKHNQSALTPYNWDIKVASLVEVLNSIWREGSPRGVTATA
jgi:hypothetical protein